jgi:hypothetical protein
MTEAQLGWWPIRRTQVPTSLLSQGARRSMAGWPGPSIQGQKGEAGCYGPNLQWRDTDEHDRMARAQYPGPDRRGRKAGWPGAQCPRPSCRQKGQTGWNSLKWTVNCPKPSRIWSDGHGRVANTSIQGWTAWPDDQGPVPRRWLSFINKELARGGPNIQGRNRDGHGRMARVQHQGG